MVYRQKIVDRDGFENKYSVTLTSATLFIHTFTLNVFIDRIIARTVRVNMACCSLVQIVVFASLFNNALK